jgi:hypothetical protein
MEEEKIILNGKEVTLQEFEEEKKRIESGKGIKLVEVTKNEYKTRLLD